MKDRYSPSVYGIGFLGEGDFKLKINNKETLEYKTWKGILRRCYSSIFHKKRPTYIGCTVDERWHNFQVFAEWCSKNSKVNFHLDKDILVRDSKIYSPETCCFVPLEVNNLLTKSNKTRGHLPIGVSKYRDGIRFVAKMHKNKKLIHLGLFNTIEEAFQAYKIAKEYHIKRLAREWRGEITEPCYKALMNYKVEITD